MTIQLKKFGEMLISRPAGREAWLAARAYTLPKTDEPIVVDFDGVLVLSPSWADEFLTKLKQHYGRVKYINTANATVKTTLSVI